jgi:RNA polymerase sigma-70 factor, ECF subfamily
LETETLDIKASFDAVFKTHYPALCRYAFGITQHLPDAEEIVQNVFIRLWEQSDHLEIQHLKAYLYRAVYTRSLNYMRDQKKHSVVSEITDQVLQKHQTVSVPGAEAELQQKIKLALNTLPTECRRVFELSRFEELKYREIAEHLQISIKTVEAQMGKALRILRTELSEYLVSVIVFSIHFILS